MDKAPPKPVDLEDISIKFPLHPGVLQDLIWLICSINLLNWEESTKQTLVGRSDEASGRITLHIRLGDGKYNESSKHELLSDKKEESSSENDTSTGGVAIAVIIKSENMTYQDWEKNTSNKRLPTV